MSLEHPFLCWQHRGVLHSNGERPSVVLERNHLWPITRRELGDVGVLEL